MTESSPRPVLHLMPIIICHGGAGLKPEEHWADARAGMARAASAGYAVLAAGGSAVDAVERAVNVLEVLI